MKAHVQKWLLDISGHSTGVCLKMGEKGAQIIQKVGAMLQTIIDKWSHLDCQQLQSYIILWLQSLTS